MILSFGSVKCLSNSFSVSGYSGLFILALLCFLHNLRSSLMSVFSFRVFATSVAFVIVLSACGEQSSSSSTRDTSADVQACKIYVDRAISRAQGSGLSDTAAYRAGEEALNACMARKGY